MKLIPHSPQKELKAFLKERPSEGERDKFKVNLISLLDKINVIETQPQSESEEHLKNNLRDFLRDTYYIDTNAINTKDKKDLVIHIGKTTNTDVAVIIEAKRPSNSKEMITADNPNKKALHELILYYLNERKEKENVQLKQLVITDINQWFIIDSNSFDKHIYRNTQIRKLYETKNSDKKDNPWFYEEVAKIVEKLDVDIPCVYFDIRDYENILRNQTTEDDKKLVALYKILSPQHLLKIASANDSNSLNERFYRELLHIIGLEEAREGSKNIIRRKKENRNAGSLMELAMDALKTEDCIHRVSDLKSYGENRDDQTFNIALELCITWVNRILFLKLLEGQLISYHEGNKEHRFLYSEMIHSFDELFKLFHKVLAINISERTESINAKYGKVPYLNSSLFEISQLEDQTIKINSLDNEEHLELIGTTILKETKKAKSKVKTLDYLFGFLDSYDFASEGDDDWQKDNKQLINASVLGKVFEKINGYQDGSVFTPAFATMYMCRQSIRMAVVDKFNSVLSKDGDKIFATFEELKNYTSSRFKAEDKLRDNAIVNSLTICDPAVGSGHFLVSALNELIAIKSELGILGDDKGINLQNCKIEIIDDELVITDYEENPIVYKIRNGKPIGRDAQRIQKTLFHEKQTIIENCLFGVDINPKSVLICRLRLWIELLKNAYYKEPDFKELETLPNIDINIKCGNSLLSRFPLDTDLGKALKTLKYDVEAYRGFVNEYKNERNREVKKGLQTIIDNIKSEFRTEIIKTGKDFQNWYKAKSELELLTTQFGFFTQTAEQKKVWNDDVVKATEKMKKYENILEEIRTNATYKSAFEWRFEFPEVLNNNGEFEGFDVVVGNPPYIKEDVNKGAFNGLRTLPCYQGKMDLWYLFGDLGLKILKTNGLLSYIATNNWVTNAGASNFRNIIIQDSQIISLIDFGGFMVFDNAAIQTMIMLFRKHRYIDNYIFDYRRLDGDKRTFEDALTLLERKAGRDIILLNPNVHKKELLNRTLTFNSEIHSYLLSKIMNKHNFFIRGEENKDFNIRAEFGNGIDVMQDFISKASAEKLKGMVKVGDGVFVLSKEEYETKGFTKEEKKIIKPYFTSKQLGRYYGNSNNLHWVIYTKSDINKPDKITKELPIDNYPNIKAHLDFYKPIITSAFGPYGLNRAREQYLFEGTKILAQRKCPKLPSFTYTEFDCYVSRAFVIIQSDRINLKYLTGLLNSKLVAFWLRKKGKMQGNAYQLDKEPLLEIPIYKPSEREMKIVASLVDKIISLKQQGLDSSALESEIDEYIYGLYEITEEEKKLIEA